MPATDGVELLRIAPDNDSAPVGTAPAFARNRQEFHILSSILDVA